MGWVDEVQRCVALQFEGKVDQVVTDFQKFWKTRMRQKNFLLKIEFSSEVTPSSRGHQ